MRALRQLLLLQYSFDPSPLRRTLLNQHNLTNILYVHTAIYDPIYDLPDSQPHLRRAQQSHVAREGICAVVVSFDVKAAELFVLAAQSGRVRVVRMTHDWKPSVVENTRFLQYLIGQLGWEVGESRWRVTWTCCKDVIG